MKIKALTPLACAIVAALGTAVPAAAETQPTRGAEPRQVGTQPQYSASMDRLLQAAQRLRETIQTLANAPAGDQRNAAIRTARAALLDTQRAMIDLPPELRTRTGTVSEAEYGKAMSELKQAAQRLRDSAQAMAQQPAGERRNDAIHQVNTALLEVNEAMVQLPWEPGEARIGSTGGAPVHSAVAGGDASFDSMDRNHDGAISRSEFSQHMQR